MPLTRKIPLLPPGLKLMPMGLRPDGSRIVTFAGSSWSVIDLRSTFAGIPKYGLGKALKGMVDVQGYRSGLLVLPPEGRGKGQGRVR